MAQIPVFLSSVLHEKKIVKNSWAHIIWWDCLQLSVYGEMQWAKAVQWIRILVPTSSYGWLGCRWLNLSSYLARGSLCSKWQNPHHCFRALLSHHWSRKASLTQESFFTEGHHVCTPSSHQYPGAALQAWTMCQETVTKSSMGLSWEAFLCIASWVSLFSVKTSPSRVLQAGKLGLEPPSSWSLVTSNPRTPISWIPSLNSLPTP